jgi:hypothetical protein
LLIFPKLCWCPGPYRCLVCAKFRFFFIKFHIGPVMFKSNCTNRKVHHTLNVSNIWIARRTAQQLMLLLGPANTLPPSDIYTAIRYPSISVISRYSWAPVNEV